MELKDDFRDIMLVDENGRIEYFSIGDLDFFDLKPEELIGKKVPQLYANLDEESSTLMRAASRGETCLGCTQSLETKGGKIVRQVSDTFCIMEEGQVKGAIEFARYDEERDLLAAAGRRREKMPVRKSCHLEEMIGTSPSVLQIKERAKKVFELDAPVLITGETGTGKELLARIIHDCSSRKNAPFMYINCSTLPETLLEGILFGICSGSFTGAEEKEGLFLLAGEGTIFLDEINSMPLSIQGKILRAIEEKRIRPVGGEEIPVSARVVAACNIDMTQLLRGEQMRKDLFFRLSVIQFELPPLRQRKADIPLLIQYYLNQFNQRFNKNIIGLDRKTEAFFLNHEWPGNVRELKNILEGAFHCVSGSKITFDDVRERFFAAEEDPFQEKWNARDYRLQKTGIRQYLNHFEQSQIEQALVLWDGVIAKAAKSLGLSPAALRYKMKKYGLVDWQTEGEKESYDQ